MAPRVRSRRAARAEPAPGPADEAGPTTQEAEAPQAAQKADFGHAIQLRDFAFDALLLSAFVERWRLETHTFCLLWGECTITLQDVAYHLGLRTDEEPVGGCMRDFQTHYQQQS
ncbi:hypothetical protein PIB30_029971 [Stylosanthes scabra]|uniref:Aminotransferase-like plant mobile domain-containing protein n=1 Tax=Stylosanthes scabra TaxID=79078 RepID=A0ABU6XCA9_9FABA|nr:hypothetical protein [Stylosanthes scabra]